MNEVFLTDKGINQNLFPLTLTRSAADIRIGILTIREKWNLLTGKSVGFIAGDQPTDRRELTVFPSNFVPSANALSSSDQSSAKTIEHPWDIFLLNDWALREDFQLITNGRHSQPIPGSVGVVNANDVFIEAGAKLSHCIINAEAGPVYIGKDAEIMEGAALRGPIAICNNAVVKMGAKIYGATTIGPYSIVGGEIKNSVMFGYSNKSHEGYLGDSVIGEWCNLGAGTSNSNMKNNVSEVRMWSYVQRDVIATGTKKCGLIMGDYSRSAINTSFNTGTMVGVCANVFGEGLVSKFVPSFSWGKNGQRYEFNKAIEDVSKWMQLKGQKLHEEQKTRLKLIFDDTNF